MAKAAQDFKLSFDEGKEKYVASVRNKGTIEFGQVRELWEQAPEKGLTPEMTEKIAAAVLKPFLEKEADQPLKAPTQDVSVSFVPSINQYEVKLPYQSDKVRALGEVSGARFSKEDESWYVPLESRYGLEGALGLILEIDQEMALSSNELKSDVAKSINDGKWQSIGVGPDMDVKFRRYHQPGYLYTGTVIGANKFDVAQVVDIDRKSGVVEVQLHDMARMPSPVLVGDKIGVEYNEKGKVELVSADQAKERLASRAQEKFTSALGKEVDGVTVTEMEQGFNVKFGFNPRLSAKLNRLNKEDQPQLVSFDRESKSYNVLVPDEAARKALVYVVADLRQESAEQQKARGQMLRAAESVLSGAKVLDADTREGQWQAGRIVAANERYVLQAAGREYFKLHDVGKLERSPEVGKESTIVYGQGKAQVLDGRVPQRSHSSALER